MSRVWLQDRRGVRRLVAFPIAFPHLAHVGAYRLPACRRRPARPLLAQRRLRPGPVEVAEARLAPTFPGPAVAALVFFPAPAAAAVLPIPQGAVARPRTLPLAGAFGLLEPR